MAATADTQTTEDAVWSRKRDGTNAHVRLTATRAGLNTLSFVELRQGSNAWHSKSSSRTGNSLHNMPTEHASIDTEEQLASHFEKDRMRNVDPYRRPELSPALSLAMAKLDGLVVRTEQRRTSNRIGEIEAETETLLPIWSS